jgi:hypothetical protein
MPMTLAKVPPRRTEPRDGFVARPARSDRGLSSAGTPKS